MPVFLSYNNNKCKFFDARMQLVPHARVAPTFRIGYGLGIVGEKHDCACINDQRWRMGASDPSA
jgi:hypothetical protein